MLLLPMSEVIIVSNPKPVANIHQKITEKQSYSTDESACKYSPGVNMSWNYKLDHNIEQFD